MKGKSAWGCKRYGKGCDVLIPMEVAGKKLTQKQVEQLVQKRKTGKLTGFKGEGDETYAAILVLNDAFKIEVQKS